MESPSNACIRTRIGLAGAASYRRANADTVRKINSARRDIQAHIAAGMLAQDAAAQPRLHINILKGDGGVNVLGSDTAVQPVVEVGDRNNEPLADVPVTFTAPNDGPSATFINGSRSITLMTDSAGEVILLGMKPVNAGRFQIAVSASVKQETVVTAISLTNEEGQQPAATGAKKKGLSRGDHCARRSGRGGGDWNRHRDGWRGGSSSSGTTTPTTPSASHWLREWRRDPVRLIKTRMKLFLIGILGVGFGLAAQAPQAAVRIGAPSKAGRGMQTKNAVGTAILGFLTGPGPSE